MHGNIHTHRQVIGHATKLEHAHYIYMRGWLQSFSVCHLRNAAECLPRSAFFSLTQTYSFLHVPTFLKHQAQCGPRLRHCAQEVILADQHSLSPAERKMGGGGTVGRG